MRITFTGKQDNLSPTQERKLATAFARLSKLVERTGEKAAQVALSSERHRQMAEVRINFFDQTLVGEGVATDQFLALMQAVENLEKRALKSREKWRLAKRDTPARTARTTGVAVPEPTPAPARNAALPAVTKKAAKKAAAKVAERSRPAQVVRAGSASGKPMTVDEAMLALEDGHDYLAYRDSATDRVHVLIRRRDGKVDLVEA
jgi:ribosomal subunit interface protein